MDKIKVLLVATHKERYYNCLISQMDRNRIPYEVLGYGYDKFNFRWRMKTYIERLRKDPNNIYILLDAFDSLCFVENIGEVYDHFIKMDCDVVFAEGGKTTGVNRYIQKKIYSECRGRQLNFAMVGFGWKMIQLLEAALGPEFGNINEEQYQLSILCNRYDRIKIDVDHNIFHVVGNDTSNIQIVNGRVQYTPKGTWPCFITGPGYSDLKKFTGECYIEPAYKASMFSLKRFETYNQFFRVELTVIATIFIFIFVCVGYLFYSGYKRVKMQKN
jgi:hypothetical protein